MLKKERASLEQLSQVDINDIDTKSEWLNFEKPVGAVTYEHCCTEHFHRDIFMATTERNYYVDRYHELCLCAHYNRRIPGEYRFEEGFQFFVTKKRMCLDIFWNLGNISDEKMILEHYDSIDNAKKSLHYRDFCELKDMIEEGINWNKTHIPDPFIFPGGSHYQSAPDKNGKRKYTIYEKSIKERREFVQFYLNNETENWDMMSVSPERLSNLIRFFKDFDDLDRRELHLRSFLPLEAAIQKNALYKRAFDTVKQSYEDWKHVQF